MIDFPANDARFVALHAETVVAYMLLQVTFPAAVGGTRRMTDAPRALTVDGLEYEAHAGVHGISPLEPQGVSDRNVLEVSWLDPDPGPASWYHRFTAGGAYTGIAAALGVVFEDAAGAMSPRFSVYAGECVAVSRETDESRVLTVRFAGPFGRRSGNPVLATDTAQRGRSATDTAFKFIAISRNIQWARQVPKGWELTHPEGA